MPNKGLSLLLVLLDLLGFDPRSMMTLDARRGSWVLCFCCYLSCLCCLSSDVYLSLCGDVYVLDDPVSWFRIIVQTFLLPSSLLTRSHQRTLSHSRLYCPAIRSVNPRPASHSYFPCSSRRIKRRETLALAQKWIFILRWTRAKY